MLSKLFSRRAKIETAPASVPDGERVYAIGDIHGRYDLLDGLLRRIEADEAARGGRGRLIFLGDYVDRGPQSAAVVERLIALKNERPDTRFLQGNHEEVFLSALTGDLKALRFFNRIGGEETILSYGVGRDAYERADFNDLSRLLCAAVPKSHRNFLSDLEDMVVVGDYVFVHAGIRPGVPLDEQRSSDLRWIREEFIRSVSPQEKVVVHGHTIEADVVDEPHRIGLDTGAYCYGTLTAMGFEGQERWLLQQSAAEPVFSAA